MKIKVRFLRHGDSPETEDDNSRPLSDLGKKQIEATGIQRFPIIQPFLLLTSKKVRAIQSAFILANVTGNFGTDPLPLSGLDYSWPANDTSLNGLVLGSEHDNITLASSLAEQFPVFTRTVRGMLIGSLLTAIEMRIALNKWRQPGDNPEIWIVGHSPFGEFMSPDLGRTTRRPNAGGFTFMLELESSAVHMHSLELFEPGVIA